MAVAASRDVAVEVAGDSLATIRNDSASTRDSSATRYLFSVSYLFELAEQAIRGNAEHIIVAFDPILGVPTRVLVDERVNTTDDEDSFVISDIVVVR
jgi:hypothetical protein